MKHILLVFTFCLTFCALSAQISINNSVFPVAGDTLRFANDALPTGIEIGDAGANQTWNFEGLSGLTQERVYLPASQGANAASFSSADLVVKLVGDLGEQYYDSDNSTFSLVGTSGSAPGPIDLNIISKYDPPIAELVTPLNYQDQRSISTKLVLPFSAEFLPSFITDSLPVQPDSIRFRINIDREEEVDAWGQARIPAGIYDVLRQKRTEMRETRLDVKVGFGPFSFWQDVTDFVVNSTGFEFLGMDTVLTYHFLAEEVKEPIAVITADPNTNQVLNVQFKSSDITTSVKYVNKGKSDIFAYPNPAIHDVRFEMVNLKSGNYTLKIFNILGMEIWEQSYYSYGNKTVKVDLTNFRKGTYLFSLIDPNGKTISTKRLMIIRP